MPNILINAGPGSGKTFTLIESYKWLLTNQFAGYTPTQEQLNIFCEIRRLIGVREPHKVVYIAFNTDIKDKIAKDLPKNCKAYTFNGLGQSLILRRWKWQELNEHRGQKLLQTIIGRPFGACSPGDRKEYMRILRYVTHLKEELLPISMDSLFLIKQKYDLDNLQMHPDQLLLIIERLMGLMGQPNGEIEHVDQVWLGLKAIQHKPYELAFVDEAQDLSTLRLEFALSVAENVVFCGDPYQSINAFAGADYMAFEKLRKVCTTEMMLKTSFRNPPNHIEYINTIRPARIVAFKTKPGPIEEVPLSNLAERIDQFVEAVNTRDNHQEPLPENVPADLVSEAHDLSNYLMISRTNANLMRVGLMLLKHKIPSVIVRRKGDSNLEEVILSYLKQLAPTSIDNLKKKLANVILQAESLDFNKGTALLDKAKCLLYLADECKRVSEIPELLSRFGDKNKGAVRLSTIHKAKGLEAPFVFILFPPIKHQRATSQAQIEQEINLEFVAESRSQYYKCYVTD